jgi:hypothetical protein
MPPNHDRTVAKLSTPTAASLELELDPIQWILSSLPLHSAVVERRDTRETWTHVGRGHTWDVARDC